MYDEVSEYLFKGAVLRFQISPTYRYRFWLNIESNAGAVWPLEDLEDAMSRGFGKIP